jgi:hypothetical protein
LAQNLSASQSGTLVTQGNGDLELKPSHFYQFATIIPDLRCIDDNADAHRCIMTKNPVAKILALPHFMCISARRKIQPGESLLIERKPTMKYIYVYLQTADVDFLFFISKLEGNF